MNWSASVLSALSSDTEPTIVVTFPSAKYIFNVGENTHRAFLQSRWNWRKTRGIFLTSVDSQRASGLAGILMSFADATIPNLDLVGPPGLLHFLAAMRFYTFRKTMRVRPTEAAMIPLSALSSQTEPVPAYQDGNITVYTVPILPSHHSFISGSITDLNGTQPEDNAFISPKRKRTMSSPLPSKRLAFSNENRAISALNASSKFSFTEEIPSSVLDFMKHPDFTPDKLEGELGQQWRSIVVNTMFPATQAPRDEREGARIRKSTKSSQEVGSTDSAAASPPGGQTLPSGPENEQNTSGYKRVPPLAGFYKRLPNFHSRHLGMAKPTLAFVVVGPRVRGKFDVKKADALGLPPGRIRGQLARGETVKFLVDDGLGQGGMVERIVHPRDCMAESESPGVILILDIPALAHVPALTSSFNGSPFFSKFRFNRNDRKEEYAVRAIFHLCGDGVLEDRRYKEFMSDFGPTVNHVVASREHSPDPVTFTSAAFSQLRLNQLDPEIFTLPNFCLTANKDIRELHDLPTKTFLLSSNLVVNICPPKPPILAESTAKYDLFHPTITSSTPLSLPASTLECYSTARANANEYMKNRNVQIGAGSDINIVTLGTGSALPSKYRNVSATLIQIPKWGDILLDAGEGTWGQLCRNFGVDESIASNVWNVLRNIKCIFISHIHGDHHIGLAKILAMRRRLDPQSLQPLYLIADRSVHLYLRELADLEDLDLGDDSKLVKTVLSEALHWKKTATDYSAKSRVVEGAEPWLDIRKSQGFAQEMCMTLGLQSLNTVDVDHRIRCFGCVMKHKEGWSIVFSGDTMPTPTLIKAGENATLLIHEATMADDQVDMAFQKAHSTFGQAVDVGRRMNAQHILLTHFSARYPKMPSGSLVPPRLGESSRRREPILALAFDHARVSIGNMWRWKFYMPAIERSFSDIIEVDDE